LPIADAIERENVVATDPVVSRELKSLQEELATARQRTALSADRPAEPAVGRGTGAVMEVRSDSAAPASRSEEPSTEQELRRQLSDLVKEISNFVDDAEKNISEHPAMSIVAAMLLGIVIGSLLGRR
jgi:ElaB/YqjD/DUF883 family membrane-anchored ribosome-binding protein